MNPAVSASSSTSSRLRKRAIGWIESLLLACLLTLVRPATTAADSAGRAADLTREQIASYREFTGRNVALKPS